MSPGASAISPKQCGRMLGRPSRWEVRRAQCDCAIALQHKANQQLLRPLGLAGVACGLCLPQEGARQQQGWQSRDRCEQHRRTSRKKGIGDSKNSHRKKKEGQYQCPISTFNCPRAWGTIRALMAATYFLGRTMMGIGSNRLIVSLFLIHGPSGNKATRTLPARLGVLASAKGMS